MTRPTALDLSMVDPLPKATQRYFDICQEKLGMVPNVLRAYAFDIEKLNAFTTFYNDLMLGQSGLSKLEREMIAVVVSSLNRCFYCRSRRRQHPLNHACRVHPLRLYCRQQPQHRCHHHF